MPFPKDPTKYPPEFAALYRRALKETFEIDIGNRELAINYVHRLHAYRRAVELEREIGYSALRSIIIRQYGTHIVFDNDSSAMSAIRSAAGMEPPTDSELDNYLAQLEQGMTDDGQPIRDSDSREQPVYNPEEIKEGKVETDYLRLFTPKENSKN